MHWTGINKLYEELGLEDSYVTVTGHSKGGNKAKYITVLDSSVDRCVSFDGQGFSDEFMTEYQEQISQNQNKIENHNVDYDYVNLLLNDVGNKTYYNPIFDSWVKTNTSQSQYLQGMRGIIISF